MDDLLTAARGRTLDPGRVLPRLASLVVVIAGLRAAAPLIVPLLLAVFLAILSLPLLEWLTRRRVPAAVASLAAVLVNLLVLMALGALVAGSVRDFTEAAPRYQGRLALLGAATLAWLEQRGIVVSGWIPAEVVNPAAVLDLVRVLLFGMAGVLSNAALVLLATVLILLEASGLRRKLRIVLGPTRGLTEFDRVRHEVPRYLGIKTAISLATGTAVALALALVGVDFPLLWGLVAFVLNYVPNLGSILAAVPAIALTLVQLGGGHALAVAVIYLGINVVFGNVLEPVLLGRRFRISTLVVFTSLIFWGWLWGPVGMLLSVPLTMVVKISLENTPSWRWLAILLEPSPGPQPSGPSDPRG